MTNKSIIIYYSRAGENYSNGDIVNLSVGNTEVVANYIKDKTDADIFKVETVNDYPDDYMQTTEVAKKEQKDDVRPELKEVLTSIDEYDTVFIGSPNWWGTLPMCMFTQLEKLDFSNKKVKVFMIHEGSGLGSTMKDIKKLCAGSDIAQALAIHGSKVNDSYNVIDEWLNE